MENIKWLELSYYLIYSYPFRILQESLPYPSRVKYDYLMDYFFLRYKSKEITYPIFPLFSSFYFNK
jgi:hypothetical protein